HLKSLDISHTLIENFPKVILTIESLVTLNISHTQIDKIPHEINFIRNLEVFDVSHTAITSLPFNIILLRNMKYINHTGCALENNCQAVNRFLHNLTNIRHRHNAANRIWNDEQNVHD